MYQLRTQAAQNSWENSRSEVEVDRTAAVKRAKRGVMGTGERRNEERYRCGWKIISKVVYNEF